ncbi:hypothetical protein ABGB12_13120 [Actinocorallia sp. B10E7]|uniref:hypothetical protein n=1 Tax=Actinocorallia sp. B10E7 TaxID=3153558 RepID=UPI00325CDA30
MSRISHAAVTAATALAAVTVAASPASAWTGGSTSAGLSSPIEMLVGTARTTCLSSTLSGTITASGALSITSALFANCMHAIGSITVFAQNLPWSSYLSGGLTALAGVRLNIATCIYGGNLTGTYTGSASPVAASFSGTLTKVSGPLYCPNTTTFSSAYVFTGPGL